jgi:hypothetical protein
LGSHLKASLRKLPLLALARQSQWMERTARKITPLRLVTAALLLISQPQISLTVLAVLLGLLSAQTVSKQAVDERLDPAASRFLKEVLGTALASCLQGSTAWLQKASWPFARIVVQDSSTIKLNEKLAAVYPGGANQHGQTPGVLRLQAVFDLLSQRWLSFSLSPYVRNDQKASPDLLPLVQKNDLVLRDLGYFAVRILEQIAQRSAFFLSRFYFRTAVFDLNGQPIDLLDRLRHKGQLDQWVQPGSAGENARAPGGLARAWSRGRRASPQSASPFAKPLPVVPGLFGLAELDPLCDQRSGRGLVGPASDGALRPALADRNCLQELEESF